MLPLICISIQDSLVARKLASSTRAFVLPVIPTIWVSLHKETAGSPKFPGYPHDYMLWPQTPVVSSVHRLLAYPELLPSACVQCVGFPSGFPKVIHQPPLARFRGSIHSLQPRSIRLRTPVTGFTLGLLF